MHPSLGDHAEIISAATSEASLKRAFAYALYHRQRSDFFYDPFELDFARQNENELLRELHGELTGVNKFQTRPAFAYFTPKNDKCFRRMIYLPFKDLVARYSFISVIGDCTNSGLYPYSFANRRASGSEASSMLLEPFASISWPSFCAWQREKARSYSVLLKTDISAFSDSISHEYLTEAIADTLGLSAGTEQLDQISTELLAEPAIDLIIGAMYYKFVRGTTRDGLAELLHAYVPKPIAIPLQNIVLRLDADSSSSLLPPVGFAGGSHEEDEPDAVADYY